MFSTRVPATLDRNRLSAAVARRRAAGAPIIDLTESNPTRVGLTYPAALLQPLADPASLQYDPQPFGLLSARAAVSREFGRRGLPVDADNIILASSTSEAYSLLFKLLCDPGDEVLVPVPSYPLFDHLARLDGVRAVPYLLEYHGVWRINRSDLEDRRSSRTRAVLTVNPNNPTGSLLDRGELHWLSQFCAVEALALVGDEVFAEYPLEPARDTTDSVLRATDTGSGGDAPFICSLGGLSKAAGLPQLKLAWIAIGGPRPVVAAAASRLELICDTYLSVGTPVQAALPALLDAGSSIRAQIQARVLENYGALQRTATAHPACRVLRAEGGWSAVLQVPATHTEEIFVLTLLEADGLLVYPGYFFDFAREAFLVVSLLPPPGAFAEGIGRLFDGVQREVGRL
jgi:alanine-synthesizing transaminase